MIGYARPRMGARVALLLLLAGAAPAGDADGEVAAAARWTEPRGCASGSGRSRASAIVREIEEAWSLEVPGILAPPVTWDGRGFVLGNDGEQLVLAAFELRTGRELARKRIGVPGPSPPRLLVWENTVIVEGLDRVYGYTLDGTRLRVTWRFGPKTVNGDPWMPSGLTVIDNEVYGQLAQSVFSVRPGIPYYRWERALVPQFTDDGTTYEWPVGSPAVYGTFVFQVVQGHVHDYRTGMRARYLHLVAIDRFDGSLVGRCMVGEVDVPDELGGRGVELAVSGWGACVHWPSGFRTTAGLRTHAVVRWSGSHRRVTFNGDVGAESFLLDPAQHRRGWIVLRKDQGARQWCLVEDRQVFVLASEADQPELFRDAVPPTVLGDVVYFGSWAADVESGRIFWKLPLRSVSFRAVPADGMVLVVEDRCRLRAFRGRGKR